MTGVGAEVSTRVDGGLGVSRNFLGGSPFPVEGLFSLSDALGLCRGDDLGLLYGLNGRVSLLCFPLFVCH